MEAIYAECRRLRDAFEASEREKIPSWQWRSEDGEAYLCREAYDELKDKTERYYQRLLDERTQRVPK